MTPDAEMKLKSLAKLLAQSLYENFKKSKQQRFEAREVSKSGGMVPGDMRRHAVRTTDKIHPLTNTEKFILNKNLL